MDKTSDASHSVPLLSSGSSVYLALALLLILLKRASRAIPGMHSTWPLYEWASKMLWKRLPSFKLSITYVMHLEKGFKAYVSIGFVAVYNR